MRDSNPRGLAPNPLSKSAQAFANTPDGHAKLTRRTTRWPSLISERHAHQDPYTTLPDLTTWQRASRVCGARESPRTSFDMLVRVKLAANQSTWRVKTVVIEAGVWTDLLSTFRAYRGYSGGKPSLRRATGRRALWSQPSRRGRRSAPITAGAIYGQPTAAVKVATSR